MTDGQATLCDELRLQEIAATAAADSGRGVAAIDEALGDCPDDPRLHFLRGSLLIGLRRFIEAHAALALAVALAPGFHVARFQLGFFELTSGEADAAHATWATLAQALEPDHYLSRFVVGLTALIADDFEGCIASLRAGIAANGENAALNGDMALIVEKCEELVSRRPQTPRQEADEVSATSFMLGTRRDRR